MDNLIFGIFTIVVCLFACFLAWRLAHRQRFGAALALIVMSGFFLRTYVANDCYLHEWDERYHALVAKNMMDSPFHPTLYKEPVLPYNYKNWAGNHIWLHKQPLPLWSMALSMKIFGVNETGLRLPSILLSTIAIWLTFYIACFFLDKRTALLAAFLHSIHGLTIEITGGRVATDHIDLFFLFFIELGIAFSILFLKRPRWHVSMAIGISIGLAILCKWLPALIVGGVWLLLALHKRMTLKQILPHALIIVLSLTAIFLPWQIYILNTFPKEALWEYSFNWKHISQGLQGHGKPWYFHLDKMRMIFGELIYLPLLWIIVQWGRSLKGAILKRTHYLSLISWIILPYLFFSLVTTKMQGYILFTGPAFFILTALFFRYLSIHKKCLKVPTWLSNIILVLLIALPIRYALERIKPFSTRERQPEWANTMRNIDEQYPLENAVIFNVERPIEMMFYTNAIAYPYAPEQQTIDSLKKEGYSIYYYKDLAGE